jgi:hypothetical protein
MKATNAGAAMNGIKRNGVTKGSASKDGLPKEAR